MLNESDDLDKLGVTFDSKMIFEKHLRSVSRAASQRLGIYLEENLTSASWEMISEVCPVSL